MASTLIRILRPLKLSNLTVNLSLLLLFIVLLSGETLCDSKDFKYVTCGSVVKLLNTKHNVRLHSHEVKYGSGSGQQSVTGVLSVDDGNSYWVIKGENDKPCKRGEPIKCDETIRLQHLATKRNLHSHHFQSPISHNQEVSAFGEGGNGDNLDDWVVVCSKKNWERKDTVRFRHKITEMYLHITGDQFGRPIHGQREVSGFNYPDVSNEWKTMEGIYIKPDSDE
ncbi:predicted protein [Nematostella vectensis]|uniref:MIR domain-containing protein n=1 Tax=Nematostella vectensis TaxID=45351 RepID=A7RSN3_NEMVE|nr:stromal cell-derived factor 2 [Nematostella vectensis]EDO45492.1 predicted protein [Nematostella vectensis]|eukprot:XP_001637555.1 predicted protein [Nematostella vectensis]